MRSRLSYANVVATLALFIALGGSSYAAIRVTGKNVANGSLTGTDVKNNSLSTSDVQNRSLLSKDFRSGQLPAGARGAVGPQGSAGAQGPTGPSTAYRGLGGQVNGVGSVATVVTTQTVPAGAYAVFARVAPQLGSVSQTVLSCALQVGGSSDSAEEVVGPVSGTIDYDDVLALTTTGELATGGAITVACRTLNAGQTFNVGSSSITAVRVASLAN